MFSVRRSCLKAYSAMIFSSFAALSHIWRTITELLWFQEQSIDFIPKTYEDEIWEKGVEPESRSLRLIYHSSHLKWHVKVTFKGTLQAGQTRNFAPKPERREHLMNLCLCINFDPIKLLDDTVTELIIMYQQDATISTPQCQNLRFKATPDAESEYTPIINQLCVIIREDPFRVRFPMYKSFGPILTKDLSEITKTQELSNGVHKACVVGDKITYVYKEVDRPLYEPRDSEVLEQELRNLTQLRNIDGVVQLVAAVVSRNPYQTMKTCKIDGQTVLRGILLKYHSNGTLKDMLQSSKKDLPWRRWAVQITNALNRLHQLDITHMDLKPANIVFRGEDLKATLIDLSGIGGTTRGWLSPEMEALSNPLSQDIDSRIQNDIWALGKILSEMGDAACGGTERGILKRVSQHATAKNLPRIPLQDVLSMLSEP